MIRRFPNPTVTATDNGCLCLPEDRIKSRNQSVTSETGEEAGFVLAGEFMAPDAEDAPAGAAKGAGDETVSGLIAGDFLPPEFRVGLGLRGVERAAVPETSVHKHRQFKLRKNEIRFAEDRRFSPPTSDAVRH